jgi:transposase
MARAINWTRYDRLKAQGHSKRDIADALGVPRTTLRRTIEKRQGLPRRSESGGPPAPVQSTVQPQDTGADHGPDPSPKGKAVRWNLWILDAIREEIAGVAAEWEMPPSQLMQEVLWQWLSDRLASTP